jgi:DNA-binding GntR family transcriptional regulator
VLSMAATEERQPAVTVMEKEMEQISEAAQAEEKEHSEEWLKIFSQEAEGETAAALKLTAREEEEHADKMLTPWEKELEMLEDWLNHPEPVDDCHEQTVMQMLAEEHSEESLRNFSQGAEQMITVVQRHAVDR